MKRVKSEGGESEEIVYLNVGGLSLDCRLSLLVGVYPESKLATFFSKENAENHKLDKNNRIFIDSNGTLFGQMLHYIRRSIPFSIVPPNFSREVWQAELNFWGIPFEMSEKEESSPPIPILNEIREETEKRMDEVIDILMKLTPLKEELLKGKTMITLLIPSFTYETTWKQCIAKYLLEARQLFDLRMKKLLSLDIYQIGYRGRAKQSSRKYFFNSVEYESSETTTLEILLTRTLS